MQLDQKILLIYRFIVEKYPEPVNIEELSEYLNLNSEFVTNLLSSNPYLSLNNKYVLVKDISAFILDSWRKGFNLFEIAAHANWRIIENLCSYILNRLGYHTISNYHFTYNKKRYEIDIIGIGTNKLLVVECKRLKRFPPSIIRKIASLHLERTMAFTNYLKLSKKKCRLKIDKQKLIIYPVIVSVATPQINLYERIPIVSIYDLNKLVKMIENEEFDFHKIEVEKHLLDS